MLIEFQGRINVKRNREFKITNLSILLKKIRNPFHHKHYVRVIFIDIKTFITF